MGAIRQVPWREPAGIRLRGGIVAADDTLSGADQSRVAARRHSQLAPEVLGERRRADPAQPDADRRDAAVPFARRDGDGAQPGAGGNSVRRAATGLAGARLLAQPCAAGAARPAPRSRCAATDGADLAGGGRIGRGANQPRHLHRAGRQPAAAWFRDLHLHGRPVEPAAAGTDRHWPRHGAAADHFAATRRGPRGRGDGDAEPGP